MDELGKHRPQQTDTRTENQTLDVLTHRQVLNNENIWTQERGVLNTGVYWGKRGGPVGGGGGEG